ncbi:DUF2331 family protein [Parasulfuritortus cantonensis]|uniref:Protein-arginine rhamnosyltransferase n=2 Tax=Parasulfuritortus cantonensis TaxID=2528202 RepID=A0A4R1BGD0_9PROT|nr:DUF2331 family protein [Parasulfuritortus cantonensis]
MRPGYDWDLFCAVVDNYGDIGITWRLARQLASEHRLRVRLWVDDLAAFGACARRSIRTWTSRPARASRSALARPFPRWPNLPTSCRGLACHLPGPTSRPMAETPVKRSGLTSNT